MDYDAPDWAKVAAGLISWSPDFAATPVVLQDAAGRLSPDQMENLRKRRVDSLVYLALEQSHPRQRLYDKLWAFQCRTIERVIAYLNCDGIDFLIFKGAEFVQKYFSGSVGMLYDVDFLIHRPDVGRVKRALVQAGFRQAVFDTDNGCLKDRDVAEVAKMELSHYELAPFAVVEEVDLDDEEFMHAASYNEFPIWTIGTRAFFVVEVDIHHGIAMDIDGSEFFLRATSSVFRNARTLSASDHLWFTASRFYVELALHGKSSLRDFAYLQAILSREDIDWNYVAQVASEYSIRPAIFYPLTFLGSISGVGIPDRFEPILRPTLEPKIRDFGWMIHLPFGFIPRLSAPAFVGCKAENLDGLAMKTLT